MKRHWPSLGVLVAIVLFVMAASRYPGGYDWAHHTISALFQPAAIHGAPSAARYFSVPAALLYCASMALVFVEVAKNASSRFHRKTIQISGIGAMVYASLVVTPMHDLMVNIALLFFVVAVSAILQDLYRKRQVRLFVAGLICISLPLANAIMYYGDSRYGMLPVVQKLGTLAWAGWLFAIYYRHPSQREEMQQRTSPNPW